MNDAKYRSAIRVRNALLKAATRATTECVVTGTIAKWRYWRAELHFNCHQAIVVQGLTGRRNSTVVACSPASATNLPCARLTSRGRNSN